MKILHIGNLKSGIDTYVRNTVSIFDERFDFVIVNGADDNNEPYIRKGKVIKNYHISMYRSLNPINDIKAIYQAVKIIQKEKPDVIHCHSAKGGIIGRFAGFITGVTTFYTPHAFSFLSAKSRKKRLIFLIFEKIARLNSKMIACSESEKKLGINVIHYNNKKAFVWNNAIKNITESDIVIPRNIDSSERFIISIGRPSYQKNPLFMVRVINLVHQKNPEIKFYMVGVGFYSPMLDEMKKLIKEYNLEKVIILVPWLSRAETLGYLKMSALYLTTSLYEGLPIAVLEAMALGKVIISSDVIGNKDCVKDSYNGFLLQMDESEFANKIIILLNDENKIAEMGNNSLKYFKSDFLIDNRIKDLENIYLNNK